ncbi:MAG: recombination protein RecR [Planctomycetes bacterium]|nr:recombination protein RecR [Planctomycetota bacterium]
MINRLARLPGLGRRSAERIALFLLESSAADVEALSTTLGRLRSEVRHCSVCRNISTAEICEVCSSTHRDRTRVCVVEMPHDVSRIEESEAYNGLYHVLLGRLSPELGKGPDDLGLDRLLQRISSDGVAEVIIATNPNVAGDATADYIAGILKGRGVNVTRPGRGLPAGSQIEFLRREALLDAFRNREALE